MRLAMLFGITCWLTGMAMSGCGGEADAVANDAGRHDGGGDGRSSADAALATHMFSLTTTEARLRKRFGFSTPRVDHVFIDVTLALKNTGEAEPLSVSPLRFSLQTADALIYRSAGFGSSLPKACPGNVSLAIGGQLECHVDFEILAFEMASTLLYVDPAEPVERAASAPMPAVKPALAVCSYWRSPTPTFCASCVFNAQNSQSLCSREYAETVGNCQFACLTTDSCAQVKSDCTPSAACTSALEVYQTCIYERCFSDCPLAE